MIDPAARRLALARETVEKLLTDGVGEKADRLVLMVDGPPRFDLGGWGRLALTDIIETALDQYGDALARAIREEDAKVAEAFEREDMECANDCGDLIADRIRALRGATPAEPEKE